MNPKTCVITGATSGIGKSVAFGMANLGYQLVVIGRNQQRGEDLKAELKASHPDCAFAYYLAEMSNIAQVKAVSNKILEDFPVIDVLINNAGGVFSDFELTPDGVERTLATNHLGYFVSTLSLLPGLRRSEDARILITSSATHYKASLDFGSFHQKKNYYIMRAYGQSKLANVMFTYTLNKRLEGIPIKANVLHPGVVKTPIGQKSKRAFHRFAWNLFAAFKGISPEKSARTYLKLAHEKDAAQYRGQYFHAGKHQDSSAESYDDVLQEKLWGWSVEQTGIDFDRTALL